VRQPAAALHDVTVPAEHLRDSPWPCTGFYLAGSKEIVLVERASPAVRVAERPCSRAGRQVKDRSLIVVAEEGECVGCAEFLVGSDRKRVVPRVGIIDKRAEIF